MSTTQLSKVRNLYIFSFHDYFTQSKKFIRTSNPIVHYPREIKSQDERLIGLSQALCNLSSQYGNPSPENKSVPSQETNDFQSLQSSQSPTQFFQSENSQKKINEDWMNMTSEYWTEKKAHTLTNKKSQWIFMPFEYFQYASIEEAESIEKNDFEENSNNNENNQEDIGVNNEISTSFNVALDQENNDNKNINNSDRDDSVNANDDKDGNQNLGDREELIIKKKEKKIVLKTQIIIVFILKRDNEENFKNEYSHLILDFWRTFIIFHSHEFNFFSFEKQYQVLDNFIKTFFLNSKPSPLVSQGISFLPVESYPFLKIQAFIHRIVEEFSNILYPQSIFLFQRYLLFSSMDHHEARVVSNHISRLHNSQVPKPHNDFLFRTGPLAADLPTIQFNPVSKNLPKVSATSVHNVCASKLNPPNKYQYLLVVDYNNIQIHLFMKEDYKNLDLFMKLQDQMHNYMSSLNSMISDKIKAIDAFDESYKYLYFNHMNLGTKSSLQKSHLQQLPQYSFFIHNMMNKFYTNINHGLREVYFKPKKDLWIYGKFFVQREYYIVFDQKIVSLTEFAHETSRFEKIFFFSPSSGSKEMS